MTIQDFGKRFLRKVDGRYSLVERRKTYDCIFLDGKQCTIYEARPTQCKTFPWWPQNLTSKQAWEETAKACEGICDKAPLVGFETIENQRLIQLQKEKKVS